VVAIEQLGDLLQGLAPTPTIPHQRLLAFAVVDPCPVLHLQHSRRAKRPSVCCIDQLNPRSTSASRRWCSDLLEVLDDLVGTGANHRVGKMPASEWHTLINDLVLADAIFYRLRGSHKLEMK